ncbi:MAG: hypothetical protein MUF68_04135, partial [Cyclobacteriaceae bacterium]|nr:hypothetical protein [Cyclobacteriaceae bacterium]
MKNSITTFATIFTLFLAHAFYAQNIITVDNNVNSSANFTTLQAALDSAQQNDFIYLYPSEQSYGSATIRKKVHLRGVGHTPEVTNGIAATVVTISYENNTPPNNPSGGSIAGLVISNISLNAANNVNNITIENNRINSIASPNNNDNWLIRGNIFDSSINVSLTTNNWLVVNNFFNVNFSTFPLTGLRSDSTVSNNIFVLPSSSSTFNMFSNSLCLVTNNIFIAQNASVTAINVTASGSNVILSNNLTFNTAGTTLAALPGTGNYDNTNPSFTTITPATNFNYSISNNYQLTNATLVG